ncbi:Ketosteroid isomerase-related protein [Streptomyces sp. 2323.1]|nr:Ketosteroid isomerase-related protein [Streptomyces sp. 2323.1]
MTQIGVPSGRAAPIDFSAASVSVAPFLRRLTPLAELEELVAEDVRVHGAGFHGQGQHYPEGAVLTPGLSNCRVQVDDLFAADDRVTVAFTLTYTHDRSGRDLTMTGIKSYRLRDGRIIEFWGETDLYGLLRQAGLVPEQVPPLKSDRTGASRPRQSRVRANVARCGTRARIESGSWPWPRCGGSETPRPQPSSDSRRIGASAIPYGTFTLTTGVVASPISMRLSGLVQCVEPWKLPDQFTFLPPTSGV